MSRATCRVEGCVRYINSRSTGLCSTHEARLRRTGTTERTRPPGRPVVPEIDRFISYVRWGDHHDGTRCMEWTGARSQGYGVFGSTATISRRAHRWLYERWFGPVPEGLELDHLCRNRACVNPSHLEPVTSAENTRRARLAWDPTEVCGHGRPLTADPPCRRCSKPKPHGRRQKYLDGCRCDACRAADRAYTRERRNRLEVGQ